MHRAKHTPRVAVVAILCVLTLGACFSTSTSSVLRAPKHDPAALGAIPAPPLIDWGWDDTYTVQVNETGVRAFGESFELPDPNRDDIVLVQGLFELLRKRKRPSGDIVFVTTGDATVGSLVNILYTFGQAEMLSGRYFIAHLDATDTWRPAAFYTPKLPELQATPPLDDTTPVEDLFNDIEPPKDPLEPKPSSHNILDPEPNHPTCEDNRPVNAFVQLFDDGYVLAMYDEPLPPQAPCPADSDLTICLKKPLPESIDAETHAHLYNYKALYETLQIYRTQHPTEETIALAASPETPIELFALTAGLINFATQPPPDDIYTIKLNPKSEPPKALHKVVWAVVN